MIENRLCKEGMGADMRTITGRLVDGRRDELTVLEALTSRMAGKNIYSPGHFLEASLRIYIDSCIAGTYTGREERQREAIKDVYACLESIAGHAGMAANDIDGGREDETENRR